MPDKITANQLQSGDIFLYHGTGFISDMIRLIDGSQYSHAAFFDGQQIIEAIGTGVTRRPLLDGVAGAKYVDGVSLHQ